MTIISGSYRAGDRLAAAGLAKEDVCSADGERHTTAHVWWDCAKHRHTRRAYVEKMHRIQHVANKHGR